MPNKNQKCYLIYKIINKINNKFYIGAHETYDQNDNYFGSGKNIKRAIIKYGKKNFSKEILFFANSSKDMYAIEKVIVSEFINSKLCYNIIEGGLGGFNHINNRRKSNFLQYPNPMSNPETVKKRNKTILDATPDYYHIIGETGGIEFSKKMQDEKFYSEFLEKHHKSLPENHQKGEKNSQYGKKFKFVNNGQINKKIEISQIDEYLLNGYSLGRI